MAISKKELALEDNKFRRVDRYIYVRNGRVYGVKWHKNKNVKRAAPMQGALAINDRGEPTKALREWIRRFREQVDNADYVASLSRSSAVPTFGEVIRCYLEIAEVESRVMGRPRAVTINNARSSLVRLVRCVGLAMDDRVDMLTGKAVSDWLYGVVARGQMRATSAYSEVTSAMSVFSRWARVKYREKGWEIPAYDDMPKPRGAAVQVRYCRPDDALRERTLAWWKSLEAIHPRMWLAVTMMIQFAMRNGDVNTLRWSDFKTIDGTIMLHYVPSKTRISTGGRGVTWPVSHALFERMRRAGDGGEYVCPDYDVWRIINLAMREIGWKGTKASYELRKMAVDQVYRTQGLERAVQISGDESKTLMRYYADASRVQFEPVDNLYS